MGARSEAEAAPHRRGDLRTAGVIILETTTEDGRPIAFRCRAIGSSEDVAPCPGLGPELVGKIAVADDYAEDRVGGDSGIRPIQARKGARDVHRVVTVAACLGGGS